MPKPLFIGGGVGSTGYRDVRDAKDGLLYSARLRAEYYWRFFEPYAGNEFVRPASLASLGRRSRRHNDPPAARSLQIRPRSNRTPYEPRPKCRGDRGNHPPASIARGMPAAITATSATT
jgi:hypothetical protein